MNVIFAADGKAKHLSLSKQDGDVISDVVEVLQFGQIVTTLLSGEKAPLCPSLCRLSMDCVSIWKNRKKIDHQSQL